VLVENLDDSLNPFRALEIESSEMGMVVGPYYDEDLDVWKIAVNVRSYSDDDATLDIEYTFEDVEGGTVLDEIYPEFVDQLESRYGEMQLQYTPPEI
jgi:hypothetical protein